MPSLLPRKRYPGWFRQWCRRGKSLSLQLGVEVDEDVATADEVELGEGRIPREIMPHEHAEVADLLADAVAAFSPLEEPRKPLGADRFQV